VLASAVALLGLSVSLLSGNEDGGVFGRVDMRDQVALLVAAVTVFALAALKRREYRRSRKG